MKINIKNKIVTAVTVLLILFVTATVAQAIGTLTPAGIAGDNTQYSLNDIYTKITEGVDAVEGTGTFTFANGTAGVATFHNLTEIYNSIPATLSLLSSTTTVPIGINRTTTTLSAIDTDLVASNIKSGTTIFGIEGIVADAGNIPSQTLSNSTTTVPYGVYATTTLSAIDTDLVAGNIKSGTTIFGIEGSMSSQQSYPVDQTLTDNGNGTVSDDATHLMWAKCSLNVAGTITDTTGCTDAVKGTFTWSNAQTKCNSLSLAGLSWRMPTITELLTIVDYSTSSPAIYGAYSTFPNTILDTYWSASAASWSGTYGWWIGFTTGGNNLTDKANTYYVRCVRTY